MSVSGNLLIKLATRCNINCSYCYWFKDPMVYEKPALIQDDVIEAFLIKLEYHIRKHAIPEFNCIFHGGEPLLYGKRSFESLLSKLERLKLSTECNITFSLTTNGLLIDKQWCDIFIKYNVGISVSIDGPKSVHDKNRVKFNNDGTHELAVNGYNLLKSNGLSPSIIAVCDPSSDPIETMIFFTQVLNAQRFNILLPDHTFDDRNLVVPVADYYIKMFDFWYEHYFDLGIEVKFFSNIIRVILGLPTNSDSFGYGPVDVVTLLTDGALEPLDVIKIQGKGATETNLNILNNYIDDIKDNPLWSDILKNSLNLCKTCNECMYKFACGGGHITTRWSKENGYDNPSVYCGDFIKIFDHVIPKVAIDLSASKKNKKDYDLDKHKQEFEELGFTVLKSFFTEELVEEWNEIKNGKFNGLYTKQLYSDFFETNTSLALETAANTVILNFLEKVWGPFVQLDELTLVIIPPPEDNSKENGNIGWHRDPYSSIPQSSQYQRPLGINVLTYLQDLNDESGPLRVIPQSHRIDIRIPNHKKRVPHPQEKLLYLNKGDVVILNTNLIHSRSPNYSSSLRAHLSSFYTLSLLKCSWDYSKPKIRQIINVAEKTNDRRTLRLFGIDDQYQFRTTRDVIDKESDLWEEWLKEDRMVLGQIINM